MPAVSERLVAFSTTPLPTEASVVGKASVTATPAPTVVPVAGPVVTAWPSPALWASVFPLAESERAGGDVETGRDGRLLVHERDVDAYRRRHLDRGAPAAAALGALQVGGRLPTRDVTAAAQPRDPLAVREATLVADVVVGGARPARSGPARSPRAVVFALGTARRGLGQCVGVRARHHREAQRTCGREVALDGGQRLVHGHRQRQRDADRSVGRARRTGRAGVGGRPLAHVLAQTTGTERQHCSTHD